MQKNMIGAGAMGAGVTGVMAAGLMSMMAAAPLLGAAPLQAAGSTAVRAAQPAERGGAAGAPAAEVEGALSVQFRGGTLAEYLRVVEQAWRGADPVNIVLSGPADQVRLEPIVVRQVDIATALQLAVNMSRTPGVAEFHVQYEELAGAFAPVHHIRVTVLHRTSISRARQETEVFSLRDLLQSEMSAETVLSAVEAALMADEEAAEPALRFHEPSSLLIVRGTVSQQATVHRIMAELKRSAAQDASAKKRRELEETEKRLRAELTRLYERRLQMQLVYEEHHREYHRHIEGGDENAHLTGLGKAAVGARAQVLSTQSQLEQVNREVDRLDRVLTELFVDRHATVAGSRSAAPAQDAQQRPRGEETQTGSSQEPKR
jgi:hypothetical protein